MTLYFHNLGEMLSALWNQTMFFFLLKHLNSKAAKLTILQWSLSLSLYIYIYIVFFFSVETFPQLLTL